MTQPCLLGLAIFLLAVLQFTATTGPFSCCPKKTVGGVSYTLLEEANLETTTYGCNSNCVYSKDGVPDKQFCFASGQLEVECSADTSTNHPTGKGRCKFGYTLVCGEASNYVGNLTTVCPANRQEHEAVEDDCSCLPVRGVERDIISGISPLGSNYSECVRVSTELVYKIKDESNTTLLANDWNIDVFVSNLTARSGRQGQDQMQQKLMQAIDQTIELRQRMRSQGRSSRFIRSTLESDAIATNYAIMKSLQFVVENDTASSAERMARLNAFQQTCEERNADLTKQSECDDIECDSTALYRSISGCCNNLKNKNFGRSNRAFVRILENAYTDSISVPRGGMNPSTLPRPRDISSTVHRVKETEAKPPLSLMLMQFGQFLDHDLTLTPEQDLECCKSEVTVEDLKIPDESLRSCFNIETKNDNFYSGKAECLPFTRSDAICTNNNVREQFNAITAFIDASQVYGSDEVTAQRLRTKMNGEMKVHEVGPTLPTRIQCGFESEHGENPEDLVGGDVRAIEQPGLASMHSLFVNEHNRLASIIAKEKPEMEDEELYQSARRLVGAQLQNIVYSEFLPIVLGNEVMSNYKLNLPTNTEDSSTYDPSVDATISNEFATVAFRFGHSLIPNILHISNNPIRTSRQSCPLRENFNQFDEFVIGSDVSGKSWQNMLLGITTQQSPAMDASINKNIIDFLFCGENCRIPGGFGQDLAARNIQRGRDHGLPAYVKFRDFCNLTVPADWDSKPDDILEHVWENLRTAYKNVEDIDPFTGGLSEEAVVGGLVGPTFACIIGSQFEKAMAGDRFFFTHTDNGAQSEKGLPAKVKANIRKRRLSDILCDNTGALSTPALVMEMSNEKQTCENKTQLNYEEIKDSILANQPKSGCQPGWNLFGLYCYRVFTTAQTWASAQSACQTEGANLASILDLETSNYLGNLVKISGKEAYIGGYQPNGLQSEWKWVGRGEWVFTNWYSGEPNDFGEEEDCAVLNYANRFNEKWNDVHCDKRVSAYVCEKKADCKCGVKKTSRIVGGTETEVNEYPWMAAVLDANGLQFCAGALIGSQWVLSAANCFFDQSNNPTQASAILIALGEHDLTTQDESRIPQKNVSVSEIITHPSYNFNTNDNDIALLKLSEEVDLTVYTPACLAESGEFFAGEDAWVYGWGSTSFGGNFADKLLEVEIPVVTNTLCSTAMANLVITITDSMLCAGGQANKDACELDEGGPLTVDVRGQHVLIGVVSFGQGCGQVGLYGVYGNVAFLRSWVDSTIAANGGIKICPA